MRMSALDIRNTTRSTPPRVPFARIKHAVLGDAYDLSLVIVGDQRSRTLNRTYRDTDAPANVLAFPLEKNAGELFLNPARAAKQADDFGMTKRTFLAYLFIHGLLHLKGYAHGSTMEKAERRILRSLNL